MRNSVWVPCTPTPEFFAGFGIVPCNAITARNENFVAAIYAVGNGGAIGLEGLRNGIAGTVLFPKGFAARRIEREKKGFGALFAFAIDGLIALEDLKVEF